ncbi:MAG TPA: hypothetical protein VFH92_01570 [Phenylobacterium sp.]|nr:hypothetical protein [Phenylobacterium sp.]
MSADADIADPGERMLARLAELDLAAAEHVHARLLAAEDAGEVADLGRSYQRLARSLRQTLALKARLKRERAASAGDAPRPKPSAAAVARRLGELRGAMHRIAWREAEEDLEAYDWIGEELEYGIAQELREDSFGDEPLDDQVARLVLKFDYLPELAAAWRDLPDPPREPEPIDYTAAFQSSAGTEPAPEGREAPPSG